VRHLINSLQYTTEGSDDDEVQLAFRAARQLEARRHGTPNYAEVAQQSGLESTAGETTNPITFTKLNVDLMV